MSAVADKLLKGLKSPTPITRIETLRVLAMVEETEALPGLRTLVGSERDSDVAAALKWAGALIYRAHQGGYTTEMGMRQYFRLKPEPTEAEKREQALIEQMQFQFDLDMLKAQQTSTNNKIGRKMVMGGFGAAFSLPILGANMLLNGSNSSATPATGSEIVPAAKTDAQADAVGITPQRPTTTEISAWLRQLTAEDTNTRIRAIIELRTLNNPGALIALGGRFALDAQATVRDEAQRAGKAIYFNWVYWAPKPVENNAARQAAPSEVAHILAKAEAARAARKGKK